ncbi:Crp/Fnr family transcriptional regulator [Dongshaea marina]|uniref:Crp/Fnr family transcriptional regulator n=1 Tax=Dongshaea marina TaxID=2047966 RepID=UPI00131EE3C3|nr:Crp/Fnr family transcriptional regulator [Dongshaea marina]
MGLIAENIRQKVPYLLGLKLFRDLSEQELEILLIPSQIKHFSESAMLLMEGSRPEFICVLLSGQARIYRADENGNEAVTRMLQAGETMFENVLFDERPSAVNGQVIREAEILFIPARAVHKLLEQSQAFAKNLIQILAERTNQMMHRVEQVAIHTASYRLGAYLLGTMKQQQVIDGSFTLQFDKSMIAKYLGMTPETFSRAIANLRKQGIEVLQQQIVLTEPDALCQFCDSFCAPHCENHQGGRPCSKRENNGCR